MSFWCQVPAKAEPDNHKTLCMKRFLPYKMKTLVPAWAFRAGQVLALTLLVSSPSRAAFFVPTELNLNINQVHESNAIGTIIGIFTADANAGVCTYSLVTGQGDGDNSAFIIGGNTLKAAIVFDYETKDNYNIRVRVTNEDGEYLERTFIIQIIDVYEITNSIEATNLVTPNGDGKNDTWIVRNLPPHSNNEVRIIDRSGRVVYYKKNYQNDWNGLTGSGELLAEGVYLYVIDFGAGLNPFKGTITLVRDRR